MLILLFLFSCSSSKTLQIVAPPHGKKITCNEKNKEDCINRIIERRYFILNSNSRPSKKQRRKDFSDLISKITNKDKISRFNQRFKISLESESKKPFSYGLASGNDESDKHYDTYEYNYKLQCRNNFEDSLKNKPEKIFKKYCKNNKQYRLLKENFYLSMSLKEKYPLDIAMRVLKSKRKEIKRIARDIIWNSFGDNQRYYLGGINHHYQMRYKNRECLIDSRCLDSFKDMYHLIKNYTAKIPLKLQKSVFDMNPFTNEGRGPDDHCSEDTNYDPLSMGEKYSTSPGQGYLGVNGNCEFTSSELLNDQNRFWNYYLFKNVTVKESFTKENNKLWYKFESKVNLNHFCRNATSINDLISK